MGILFVVVTPLVSSVGATDDGELQVLLAAALVAIGTLVGLYAAWRPSRVAWGCVRVNRARSHPLLRHCESPCDEAIQSVSAEAVSIASLRSQ